MNKAQVYTSALNVDFYENMLEPRYEDSKNDDCEKRQSIPTIGIRLTT